MRALQTEEWLNMWELGLAQRPTAWAVALLAAACPELGAEQLAQMSIGQRDARLLRLRQALFGSQAACLTECPQCGAPLELAFDLDDIRAPSADDPMAPEALPLGEWLVRFRLPNSLDVMAVADLEGEAAARQALYRRCVLSVECGGAPAPADQAPEDVTSAVVARMAQRDPQADVRLDLACPDCAHHWLAGLNIVSFLWSELDAWAIRTLRDVHTLASAYGWREADILATSPWRRQLYLQLIGER